MNAMLLWMTLLPSQLAAEPTKPAGDSKDDAQRAEVMAMAKTLMAQCEFSSGGKSPTKFVLHPEPILRWSNPTAGSVFGDVYVLTENGRPAVVAGAYRWFSNDWGDAMEVCSLSAGPVFARQGDVTFWKSDKPGVRFQPVKNADAPAKSAPARLSQMRRIANDFVTQLTDTRGDTAGVKRQLRMLSQPVYRYPAANEKSDYLDGALFAFVEGTDPEVLLLIEASSNQSPDDSRWQFALARINRDALQVTYRDEAVWSAPYIDNPMILSREPYALFSLNGPLREAESKARTSKPAGQP